MKLNKLTPILYSNDLQGTVDFYVRTLGFTCKNFNKEPGWGSLQLDGVEIMLSLPNAHTLFNRPVFTGSFYINTDNVDQLWEMVKNKVSVCYPIENF
jgi:uncharacterized glyoxalase superfamily protein PhnB